MTDLASPSATIHPIGWTFLGAGGLAWLWPLVNWLQPDLWKHIDKSPIELAVLVFALTLLGACLDFALGALLERKLIKWYEIKNPSDEKWAAAWRTRWRSATADSEFRRHEGMVSLARTYMLHSLLAGFTWAAVLRSLLLSPLAIVIALLLIWFFLRMWVRFTSLIVTIVNSAAKWEHLKDKGAA